MFMVMIVLTCFRNHHLQAQVSLQARQQAADVQAVYNIIGRTLTSFERYAQKVTGDATRYALKYQKHKVSIIHLYSSHTVFNDQ